MNRPDKGPIGPTVLKSIAGTVLVLVALAFGAAGACGVFFAGSGLWETLHPPAGVRNDYAGAGLQIGAICAAVGLTVAALAAWAAVLMFRKRRDRGD